MASVRSAYSVATTAPPPPDTGVNRGFARRIFWFAVTVAVVGAALTELPPWHVLLEWNRLQTPLYGIAASLVLLASIVGGWGMRLRVRVVLGLIALTIVAKVLVLQMPFFAPPRAARDVPPTGVSLGAVLALDVRNEEDQRAARAQVSPDSAFVGIWGDAALRLVDDIGATFPTVVRGEGVALLSRFPVRGVVETTLGEDAAPGLYTILELPGGALMLVAVLDLPPLVDTPTMSRNRRAIRRVATEARHAPGPVVVMGDLQGRLGAYLYSILIEGSDLRDVAWGSGWWFPGDRFPLRRFFALNHILVKGAQIEDAVALPWPRAGSAPLRVELTLPRFDPIP